MSKSVLVTGSNGQLGSEIRQWAESSDCKYIFTDLAELDITNVDAVRDMVTKLEVGYIINCAAYTAVDKAEDDQDLAYLVNHKAVESLAIVSKECGVKLVHVSTDYVFSGKGNTPLNEEQQTEPIGVYGQSKLVGEQSVMASGCEYMIVRTSWLYSQYGHNFVKTIRSLSAQRDSLKVVFDQVGTPTHAKDLAQAICTIVETKEFVQGVYHYSNEGVCSWFDFAREIVLLSGHECEIAPCYSDEFPSKVTRPSYSVLDKTKIKQIYNLSVPYWRDSLKECIDNLK